MLLEPLINQRITIFKMNKNNQTLKEKFYFFLDSKLNYLKIFNFVKKN